MNAVTIVGNLTREPELRYTSSGRGLCTLGIAVNTRRKNSAGEWEDGDPQFYNVTVWGDQGENVAELTKGTRVIVAGRLQYRSWEADDGTKRSAVDIVAEEVAPSLRWATATVTRQSGSSNKPAKPAATGGYDYDEEPF